jgi:Ca2+-binding EF-hand superfamily protein
MILYLRDVFKDLSGRKESDKQKGISKVTFFDYLKIPIFISEKLFCSFDLDNNNYLNFREFSDGLVRLYSGDFDQTSKLIFSLYDFDKDGSIRAGDVKIILSYLPIKTEIGKEYFHQIESLNDINEIVHHTFGEKTQIDEDEFMKSIQCKKSDIFLQPLCFLFENRPFSPQNINLHGKTKPRSLNDISRVVSSLELSGTTHRKLIFPSKRTRLSCADKFIKNQSDFLENMRLSFSKKNS